MTENQTAAPTDVPQLPEPVYAIVSEPETRLAQLHAAFAHAKADADAANERLKGITDSIKAELAREAEAHGTTKAELHTPGQRPLRLTYAERWTVDSKKLKAEDPVTYVKYAKKGGSWSLREVPASEGGES